MSIKSCIIEMEEIQKEIKLNNKRNLVLRKRIKEIELNIIDYIKQNNNDGLKYNGKTIIIEKKQKFSIKKKQEKKNDMVSFLQSLGLSNSEEIFNNIQKTQKGNMIEKDKLKIQNIRQD